MTDKDTGSVDSGAIYGTCGRSMAQNRLAFGLVIFLNMLKAKETYFTRTERSKMKFND